MSELVIPPDGIPEPENTVGGELKPVAYDAINAYNFAVARLLGGDVFDGNYHVHADGSANEGIDDELPECGDLDATNIDYLSEGKLVFSDAGHNHTGGIKGKVITTSPERGIKFLPDTGHTHDGTDSTLAVLAEDNGNQGIVKVAHGHAVGVTLAGTTVALEDIYGYTKYPHSLKVWRDDGGSIDLNNFYVGGRPYHGGFYWELKEIAGKICLVLYDYLGTGHLDLEWYAIGI